MVRSRAHQQTWLSEVRVLSVARPARMLYVGESVNFVTGVTQGHEVRANLHSDELSALLRGVLVY